MPMDAPAKIPGAPSRPAPIKATEVAPREGARPAGGSAPKGEVVSPVTPAKSGGTNTRNKVR